MKNKQNKNGEKSLNSQAINVTKTYLPNKEKYISYIDEIYKTGWVTNYSPLVQKLEKRLAEYLDVKNIVLVSNGTMALNIAYKLLNLKDEIITTPFSFIATSSSLKWSGLSPIFADINLDNFNISPEKIEERITNKTSAILPVHVFGNACDIEKIQEIAINYNLPVIYDASHAFNIIYNNQNILNYGNISTISFHATKLFHTIEGGALIINDDELAKKARLMINFGIKGPERIEEVGINGKMNEFEAAMGLCMLDEVQKIMEQRKLIYNKYKEKLKAHVILQKLNQNATYNYSYFPILLKNEESTLKVQKALNKKNIFPRRYFYPSLDTINLLNEKRDCFVSQDISKRILCLPIHSSLDDSLINLCINTIIESI